MIFLQQSPHMKEKSKYQVGRLLRFSDKNVRKVGTFVNGFEQFSHLPLLLQAARSIYIHIHNTSYFLFTVLTVPYYSVYSCRIVSKLYSQYPVFSLLYSQQTVFTKSLQSQYSVFTIYNIHSTRFSRYIHCDTAAMCVCYAIVHHKGFISAIPRMF
jgi:hypothetical protein